MKWFNGVLWLAWITALGCGGAIEETPIIEEKEDPRAIELSYLDRIRADSSDVAAHYELGAFYLEHAVYGEALRYFSETFRIDSLHVRALLGAGEVMTRQGELERALAVYRKAIALAPDSAAVYRQLGQLYLRTDDDDRARATFAKALKLAPDHAPDHYNLGVAHARDHDYKTAAQHMQRALEIDPEYALVYYSLADMYCAKMGQCERAVDMASKAVKIEPTRARYRTALGRVYMRLNRHEEAEAAFRAAIERDSAAVEALNGLGMVLAQQGKEAAAAAVLEQSIALYPAYPEAHLTLSKVYMKQGKAEEGQKQIEMFKRLDPHFDTIRDQRLRLKGHADDAVARYNLGVIYAKLGFAEMAAQEYKASLKINPAQIQAWQNLGTAYMRLQRVDDAITAYRQALTLDEGYALAWFNLGNAYLMKDYPVQARAAYERALAIKGNYVDAINGLGNAKLREGKAREAIDDFKAVLRVDSTYVGAHYSLAVAYREVGDSLAAQQQIRLFARKQKERTQ